METMICSICEYIDTDNSIHICSETGDYLCDGCVTTSRECDTPFKYVDSIHQYRNICFNCQDGWVVCYRCDEIVDLDCTVTPMDADGIYCDPCTDDCLAYCEMCDGYYRNHCNCYDSDDRDIHDYGYRPDFLHKWLDGDLLTADSKNTYKFPYLGMEIEMEASHCDVSDGVEIAQRFCDNENIYYLKSDGSIEYGFELVTHPMTLSWAMQKFPWEGIDQLRKTGMRSYNTSTCGVHIHINRRAFISNSHQWKFCYLINKNQSFSESIAGRRNNHYASFVGQAQLASKVIAKKTYQENRYASINLQNHATVEVRIFKGTLKVSRLKSYLQFVDAVFQYTKDLTIQDCLRGALRDSEFAQWIIGNVFIYPELCAQRAIQSFIFDDDNEMVEEVI